MKRPSDCYDDGDISDLKTRNMQTEHRALFLPYRTHQLNLVVQDDVFSDYRCIASGF